MSLLRSYLDFAEQLKPGYTSRLQGASASEIARLETLAATPFPPLFRDYLAQMGRENGLLIDDTGFKSITDLIELYEDYAREETPFDPGLILVAFGETIQRLVLDTSKDSVDPPLYVASECSPDYLYAEHFSTFLFRQAFIELTVGKWPRAGTLRLTDKQSGLEDVSKVIRKLKLTVLPFSDACVLCAQSLEGQLVAQHIEKKQRPVLWLNGSEAFINTMRTAFGPDVRFQQL